MMTDFENPLRNALKKSFPNSIILGCFFHYLKAIVSKFKEYGLLNKKLLIKSYNLIFFFKLYPLVLPNDKTETLEYMIEKCINENNSNEENFKLKKIFLYFIKNWYGTEITDFSEQADNILKFRINNTVERFNLLLNIAINHIHKLSYFFEKYKNTIKDAYNKYISQILNINNNQENNNHFITQDIYNFSLHLVEKYKCNLGSELIAKLNESDETELKKYLFNILNQLYAIEEEDDIDYKNEDSEDSDFSNYSDKVKINNFELETPDNIKKN